VVDVMRPGEGHAQYTARGSNAGGRPARLLVIHAPAMDAYFAALHELRHRDEPPTTGEERALMARFGMERA
jgi:hypothetical protein